MKVFYIVEVKDPLKGWLYLNCYETYGEACSFQYGYKRYSNNPTRIRSEEG